MQMSTWGTTTAAPAPRAGTVEVLVGLLAELDEATESGVFYDRVCQSVVTLTSMKRAVLLLHDVFDYGYEEIAGIVGKSEVNVRQLASRARTHVEQGRPRFQTSREQREELAQRFLAATQQGDLAGLEALLAHDVVLTGDGGGKVPTLARSLRGRNRVARMLLTWMRVASRIPDFTLRPTEVNGGPGVMVLDGQERLISVWSLEIGPYCPDGIHIDGDGLT